MQTSQLQTHYRRNMTNKAIHVSHWRIYFSFHCLQLESSMPAIAAKGIKMKSVASRRLKRSFRYIPQFNLACGHYPGTLTQLPDAKILHSWQGEASNYQQFIGNIRNEILNVKSITSFLEIRKLAESNLLNMRKKDNVNIIRSFIVWLIGYVFTKFGFLIVFKL